MEVKNQKSKPKCGCTRKKAIPAIRTHQPINLSTTPLFNFSTQYYHQSRIFVSFKHLIFSVVCSPVMSFTIKELEALSGIKAHTIRIWEQRYHFLKPSRTQTNIRKYTNEELKTLLTVALLNKNGYKISRIDHMPPEQRLNTILQLNDQDARREQVVNELIAAMIDLDMLLFEKILMLRAQ